MATYDDFEAALELVKHRLSKLSHFNDLTEFETITYTKEELAECGDERDWVGQYSKGSVDSESGILVLIAIDKHEGIADLADTITHELGHALWELLDEEGQQQWLKVAESAVYGPEEAFADELMYLARGDDSLMTNKERFLSFTEISPVR